MITFRYHLVSVIAVFLALALGVVVGSTLIDRAIVEGLEAQVDDVQERLDRRAGEVSALRGEITDLQDYGEESWPWTTERQLDGTSVVVVAERGVERTRVEDLVVNVRQAGGTTPGVLWLNESWVLDDVALREDLVTALDVRDGDAAEARARVWGAVLEDVATATVTDEEADAVGSGQSGEGGSDTSSSSTTVAPEGTTESTEVESTTTTTTAEPTESTGALATVVATGIVEFEPLAEDVEPLDLGGGRLRVVVLTQRGGVLADAGIARQLAEVNADAGVPTLVAEERGEEDGPASAVSSIREDDQISSRVATVDDFELLQGRVATVLGVAQLGRGVVGHYGYGDDAERIVPEWSPPADE